jgi:hypothetical protein
MPTDSIREQWNRAAAAGQDAGVGFHTSTDRRTSVSAVLPSWLDTRIHAALFQFLRALRWITPSRRVNRETETRSFCRGVDARLRASGAGQ